MNTGRATQKTSEHDELLQKWFNTSPESDSESKVMFTFSLLFESFIKDTQTPAEELRKELLDGLKNDTTPEELFHIDILENSKIYTVISRQLQTSGFKILKLCHKAHATP